MTQPLHLWTTATFAFCIALAPAAKGAVNFEKDLLPVIQKKCIDCHAAPKEVNGKKKEPKADLRLDAAFAIVKGSKNGKIFTPKESGKSRLYEVVTLPVDDDDAMPPKGKADPLTDAEKTLLKQWIDEGASFGTWEGNIVGKPADPTVRQAVETKREHLDLGRTKITDAALATVAKFPRLAKIDLRQTAVTDKGLEALSKLKNLQTINLYGTEITDAGLAKLGAIKSLRHVTAWQSKATEKGAAALKKALPKVEVTVK